MFQGWLDRVLSIFQASYHDNHNHDYKNHDDLIIVIKNNHNISIFNDNCPTLVVNLH